MAEWGLSPLGIWNIFEIIIFFAFIAQGIFFVVNYKRQKTQGASKGFQQITIGYAFFFFANAANQFVYIFDSIRDLWHPVSAFIYSGEFFLYLGSIAISLKTQIVLMVMLLFFGVNPVIKPLELYIENRAKAPVYKMGTIGLILCAAVFVVFLLVGRIFSPTGPIGDRLLWADTLSWPGGLVINYGLLAVMLYIIVVMLLIMAKFVGHYLVMSIKSPPGALRSKALIIFVSFLLFYGALFIGNGLKDVETQGWLILGGPITFLVASLVLMYGFNKKIT